MSEVMLDHYMIATRDRDELRARVAELEKERDALRDSLIHACELRRVTHEHERQLWAIRQAANHTAKPFSHDWVEEKYNEWPSEIERLTKARSLALGHAVGLKRKLNDARNALESAINWIASTQYRVSDQDHAEFADWLQKTLDGTETTPTETIAAMRTRGEP